MDAIASTGAPRRGRHRRPLKSHPGGGPWRTGLKYYYNWPLQACNLTALLAPAVAGKPQKNPCYPWPRCPGLVIFPPYKRGPIQG